MKTIKYLLTFCLIFLSFSTLISANSVNNGTWYFSSVINEPKAEYYPGDQNDYCSCTCDACRNCNHRDPDKEVFYEENSYMVMSSRDFAEFKQFIANRIFESTKLDMTKGVIDNNLFATDQVSEILSWFVFESNKLELAKYTFKNTVDRSNYYKLYDIFVFESNVVELDNYIKKYR